MRPSESRACNSFSQSEHKSMHYWPLGWARWSPGWFMGLPTFQALDMSAFHSGQGRGYDCNKIKNKLWDVFAAEGTFWFFFSKFWKVKVCGGSVWDFSLKVETFLRTFPDTPPESPKNGILKGRILLSTRYFALLGYAIDRSRFFKNVKVETFFVDKGRFEFNFFQIFFLYSFEYCWLD